MITVHSIVDGLILRSKRKSSQVYLRIQENMKFCAHACLQIIVRVTLVSSHVPNTAPQILVGRGAAAPEATRGASPNQLQQRIALSRYLGSLQKTDKQVKQREVARFFNGHKCRVLRSSDVCMGVFLDCERAFSERMQRRGRPSGLSRALAGS
jgi:hypothetical protein